MSESDVLAPVGIAVHHGSSRIEEIVACKILHRREIDCVCAPVERRHIACAVDA